MATSPQIRITATSGQQSKGEAAAGEIEEETQFKGKPKVSARMGKQFWFGVSSLIGSVQFLMLFAFVLERTKRVFDSEELAFSISYNGSYLVSIAFQHILNHWLVFTPTPGKKSDGSSATKSFFLGMLQAYFIYGGSMIVSSLLGSFLISMNLFSPKFVPVVTMPVQGIINFYVLNYFSSSKGN